MIEACKSAIDPLIDLWNEQPGTYNIMLDLSMALSTLVESYPHEELIQWQAEYQSAFDNLNTSQISEIIKSWPGLMESLGVLPHRQ